MNEPLPARRQTTWHRVAERNELPDGGIKAVAVGGVEVVIIRTGKRYGALNGRCPHAGGPLAQGAVENGYLVCPWHGREYDPVTGACEGYAEAALAYTVETRDDGVYVAL